MLFFLLFASGYWYHKCPLVLSTPHDICLCIENFHVFVQDENGKLEKWLKINKHRVVQKVYPVAANTNYICHEIRYGDVFNVVVNGSWFCDRELVPITDIKQCYWR